LDSTAAYAGGRPVFESSAQAQRIIGILMRRFNDICRMFGEKATGFEPLLYTKEVNGETKWIGEDWCVGLMEAVDLSFDEWQPFFDDKPGCTVLAPILTLGTEVGWVLPAYAPELKVEYLWSHWTAAHGALQINAVDGPDCDVQECTQWLWGGDARRFAPQMAPPSSNDRFRKIRPIIGERDVR
jgi:uncharacterized protein UPF0149